MSEKNNKIDTISRIMNELRKYRKDFYYDEELDDQGRTFEEILENLAEASEEATTEDLKETFRLMSKTEALELTDILLTKKFVNEKNREELRKLREKIQERRE